MARQPHTIRCAAETSTTTAATTQRRPHSQCPIECSVLIAQPLFRTPARPRRGCAPRLGLTLANARAQPSGNPSVCQAGALRWQFRASHFQRPCARSEIPIAVLNSSSSTGSHTLSLQSGVLSTYTHGHTYTHTSKQTDDQRGSLSISCVCSFTWNVPNRSGP